jgi:Helix-turn-helix domain
VKPEPPSVTPEYLDLTTLATYSSIGRRSLERYLRDPAHPLPHYKPGGKVLVKISEFDRWIAERQHEPDVRKVVADVLARLKA